MQALLIIDVQNDFLPGGALAIPHADEVIPVINELMSQFDVVLATQDWHPPNHVSFAATHRKSVGEVIQRGNRTNPLACSLCPKYERSRLS